MAEKLVFDHTLESLLRTLKEPYTPAQLAELNALGIDLSKPLRPGYPADVYAGLIDLVVRQRWPRYPREEGIFEAGRAFIHAYRETVLGKALAQLLPAIGPHRVLGRMSRNFRSANNFTETQLRQVGPTSYELWFNFVSRPPFFAGMVYEVLTICGVKRPDVKLVTGSEGTEVTYHVSWES